MRMDSIGKIDVDAARSNQAKKFAAALLEMRRTGHLGNQTPSTGGRPTGICCTPCGGRVEYVHSRR